ncbi:MAG: 3-deoxy-D-manno-octulosonate 8-phosphate phosphatase [Bacteroidota bacterium]
MNYLEKFKSIGTFILDVDGVLTNGELIVLENGHLLRKMNVRDGLAIKTALQCGYRVAVITGGNSSGVIQRLRKLGVNDIYAGIDDKLDVFEEYIYTYDIDPASVLYMGDDWPDYPPMRRVGLPVCPSDAIPEIMEVAQYISPIKGGEGCVRDVIEKTLRLNHQWLNTPKEISRDEESL